MAPVRALDTEDVFRLVVPRLERLGSAHAAELWALACTMQWAGPRAETRSMGTGLLTLTVPGGGEQVMVAAGTASAALDAWRGGG